MKKIKKLMMLVNVVCMLSLAVCGCGKISKLGEMQFDMKADNKVVKEDGTIESRGNGHKLIVLYDEETIFYIRTIYDDGSSYEDKDATAEDMAKDMMVEITGYYEGKNFHAVQVQLMKFE